MSDRVLVADPDDALPVALVDDGRIDADVVDPAADRIAGHPE